MLHILNRFAYNTKTIRIEEEVFHQFERILIYEIGLVTNVCIVEQEIRLVQDDAAQV